MEDYDQDKRLFVVYLGGDPPPGRLSEDHEVVLVVAGDLREARRAARAKWGGRRADREDWMNRALPSRSESAGSVRCWGEY